MKSFCFACFLSCLLSAGAVYSSEVWHGSTLLSNQKVLVLPVPSTLDSITRVIDPIEYAFSKNGSSYSLMYNGKKFQNKLLDFKITGHNPVSFYSIIQYHGNSKGFSNKKYYIETTAKCFKNTPFICRYNSAFYLGLYNKGKHRHKLHDAGHGFMVFENKNIFNRVVKA